MYAYIYMYVYISIYTGLETGGVSLQNANLFWGNCKSLWQSDKQDCESHLGD